MKTVDVIMDFECALKLKLKVNSDEDALHFHSELENSTNLLMLLTSKLKEGKLSLEYCHTDISSFEAIDTSMTTNESINE